MSVHKPERRTTVTQITARKGGEPIVSLTCHHAQIAAIAEQHCDFLLTGDSLGMVVHGFDTTLPMSLEAMIMHTAAVVRGTKTALVVADMPFGAYEESPEQAFRNAARILKESQCGAVKLEGGGYMAETIAFLVRRGIPVLAHVGLTPQSVNVIGGFKTQGIDDAGRGVILDDARAVAQAGAFAVVLEAMPEPLAAEVTGQVPIPTIGIGASARCDGQILVLEDMLGLTERAPRFVKRYGNLAERINEAVASYAGEVRVRAFPAPKHTYKGEIQ